MTDEAPLALGVPPRKVLLSAHDPRWDELYRIEERRVREAIGHLVVDIQHFGSTSIPGIRAKPIIDMLVGLRRFEDGAALVAPLTALGYDYVGTEMVPNDHLFGLGADRTHLLHGVLMDGYHWRRNLRFRDRLRAEPDLVRAYEDLKVELAIRHADDRPGYTAAKKTFIDAIADS